MIEIYIKQFNEWDKSSFTFRYPINKELDILFNDAKYLDLINLREKMNYIIFLRFRWERIFHKKL